MSFKKQQDDGHPLAGSFFNNGDKPILKHILFLLHEPDIFWLFFNRNCFGQVISQKPAAGTEEKPGGAPLTL
jgi:hypothetical protein